jgi:hypothetical protein
MDHSILRQDPNYERLIRIKSADTPCLASVPVTSIKENYNNKTARGEEVRYTVP